MSEVESTEAPTRVKRKYKPRRKKTAKKGAIHALIKSVIKRARGKPVPRTKIMEVAGNSGGPAIFRLREQGVIVKTDDGYLLAEQAEGLNRVEAAAEDLESQAHAADEVMMRICEISEHIGYLRAQRALEIDRLRGVS